MFDWNIYNEYKEQYRSMIYSYLRKTNIPDYMYDGMFEDIVIDSILTNSKIENVLTNHITVECRHHHHRISFGKVETNGHDIVDTIYTYCRDDICKLITALPTKFIISYCSSIEQDILINLIKYKSPKEVGRMMGVTGNLISQRIAGMKKKFKKFKSGLHIKLHNNTGDRYEIDDSKLTTDLRTQIARLYKDGLTYENIGKLVDRTTKIVAQIIYSIKLKPGLTGEKE